MSCASPDEMMPRRKAIRHRDKDLCHTCQENRSQFISRHLPFCEPCFRKAISIRFTRTLHSGLEPGTKSLMARPARRKTHVLIPLSGGAGSMTLLDILHERGYWGKEDEVRDIRKGQKDLVWPGAWAVHVDFSSVTGMQSRTEPLRDLAEGWGMQFLALRAEDAFDPTLARRIREAAGVSLEEGDEERVPFSVDLAGSGLPLHNIPSSSTQTPLEALRSLLAGLPAPSRPTLLALILDGLIGFAARTLPNISHVLEGETSTRQAQRVIGATAEGRGWSLPLELATRREIGEGIVRLKPMKEITVKEAAVYCRTSGLETVNERRWDNTVDEARRDARGKGAFSSIEALTERFIATLNVSHPSTVTTINRTGNKLHFAGTREELCPLCEQPVDPSAVEWKARASLTSLPGRGPEKEESAKEQGEVGLKPLLCYSCLTAFTPLTAAKRDQLATTVPLPLWVGPQVAKRQHVSQAEMRKQIDAFLISDDDL